MTPSVSRTASDPTLQAISQALGADWPFEIITTGRWEMAGRIAERYQAGRTFLAGDAAHQLPPTRGGFGANTGMDDAYNIALKLQGVLSGWSDPRLLDTYTDERQPIGWLRHQQTFARPDYGPWVGEALKRKPLYGNEAMELGQLSRSSAVVGAGSELPPAASPEEWAGQPGTRAPHVWIEHHGKTISTIDLFTRGFVLISPDFRWIDAARRIAAQFKIELEAVHVGADVAFPDAGSFERAFGVSDTGASLVRPDGIVAWRSTTMASDPVAAVRNAISRAAALR